MSFGLTGQQNIIVWRREACDWNGKDSSQNPEDGEHQ